MIVCYQSCKCCLELIKLSIESIEQNNENVIFFIFNNKITHFFEDESKEVLEDGTVKIKKIPRTERKDEYEYSKDDIKEIRKLCKRLIIVNNDKWMDIFDECPTKKAQTNTFSRLLFSRFFQKLNKNEKLKTKINEYLLNEFSNNIQNEIKSNSLDNLSKDIQNEKPVNKPSKNDEKENKSKSFENLSKESQNEKHVNKPSKRDEMNLLKNVNKYIYCDEDVICDGPIDNFWNLTFDHNFFKGFRNSFANRNKVPLFRMKPLINDGLQLVNSSFRINDPEYIKLLNVQIICKIIERVVCRTQAITNWYGIDDIVLTTKEFESLHESARIRQLLCLKYYHICHTDGNKNNLPVMKRVHNNLIEKYNLFDKNSMYYVL